MLEIRFCGSLELNVELRTLTLDFGLWALGFGFLNIQQLASDTYPRLIFPAPPCSCSTVLLTLSNLSNISAHSPLRVAN